MKKNYNQPSTDVLAVNTEYMMQGIEVSVNGSNGNQHPTAGAPGRGDIIP